MFPQQFGLDMFSLLFFATVDTTLVRPRSVWIGEMSITGIVPANTTTITGDSKPYTF